MVASFQLFDYLESTVAEHGSLSFWCRVLSLKQVNWLLLHAPFCLTVPTLSVRVLIRRHNAVPYTVIRKQNMGRALTCGVLMCNGPIEGKGPVQAEHFKR